MFGPNWFKCSPLQKVLNIVPFNQSVMNIRVPIFVSYAHEDRAYLDMLLTHLEPLKMQDQVCAWSDKDLEPGTNWSSFINLSIANAKVFVLLISKHFLASDFIRKSELPNILNKHLEQKDPILPIIINPCLFDLSYFKYPDSELGPHTFDLSAMQFFNNTDKPLSDLTKNQRDIVFVKLAKHIVEIVKR